MSIYTKKSRRKNGKAQPRYAVMIDLAPTETGGRRRQYVGTFRTKKEAESAERKAMQQRDEGIEAPSERVTVRSIVERYIERCRAKDLAPTTIGRYEELAQTIYDTIGNVLATKLGSAQVSDMYAKARANGLSSKTVRHIHGLLHAALKWAVERNLCLRNVASIAARDLPKLQKSPARSFTEDEVRKLLNAAKETPWYAFFVVALCTGTRRGEIAALRWSAVDFERNCIVIERSLCKSKTGPKFKTPKTGVTRRVPLNGLAVAALKAQRAKQNEDILRNRPLYDREADLVFADQVGQAWNLSSISNAFSRIAKDAGVTAARLHDLRHTCATWALQSGVDIRTVSAVLGHSSATTTLSTYSHVLPGADVKAVEIIAKRLESAV